MALDTSNPKFQKAALIIMVILGAGYAYYSYIFTPRQEELSKIETEVEEIEIELENARIFVESADTMKLVEGLERVEEELILVESLLPKKENLPDLLENIANIGDQIGVKFALFQPSTPIQHEIYQERPYSVTLRGGYHQTARFLADVAGFPQIIKPSGLNVIRERAEGGGGVVTPGETLTAKMTLTTFLMIHAPPSEENKK